MGGAFDFFGALVSVIVEAILKVLTSSGFMKAILATFTYVFLFSIVPLLITNLVPSSVMHAADNYSQMLEGGSAQMVCGGTQPLVQTAQGASTSISCQQVVNETQWGQGIAYVLNFLQFNAFLATFLPAMVVRFLFKRI